MMPNSLLQMALSCSKIINFLGYDSLLEHKEKPFFSRNLWHHGVCHDTRAM